MPPNVLLPLCLFREAALFDMAAASSVQVVMVVEPLIQYSSSLFPEGIQTPNTPDEPPLCDTVIVILIYYNLDVSYALWAFCHIL